MLYYVNKEKMLCFKLVSGKEFFTLVCSYRILVQGN